MTVRDFCIWEKYIPFIDAFHWSVLIVKIPKLPNSKNSVFPNWITFGLAYYWLYLPHSSWIRFLWKISIQWNFFMFVIWSKSHLFRISWFERTSPLATIHHFFYVEFSLNIQQLNYGCQQVNQIYFSFLNL